MQLLFILQSMRNGQLACIGVSELLPSTDCICISPGTETKKFSLYGESSLKGIARMDSCKFLRLQLPVYPNTSSLKINENLVFHFSGTFKLTDEAILEPPLRVEKV